MNAKLKILALIGVTTAALGAGGAALADRGGRDGGCGGKHGEAHSEMRGDHQGRGMMRRLDLDEAQRARIAQLRESMEPQWESLRERMQANREAMRELRGSDSFDAGQLGLLADQRGALIAEQIKLRADMQAQMMALLSDEQREQMRERRGRHL